jgi:hypothetical protein
MDQRLQSLLGTLRSQPGMYLGQPSVVRLRAFLDGYFHALFELGIQPTFPRELHEFRDWIYAKYAVTDSIGWEEVLVNVAGDERSAFGLFQQLWDEFESMHRAANKGMHGSGG